MKKNKVYRIALDRKTGATVGFSKKKYMDELKLPELFKGKKRYTGFANYK